MGSGPRGHTVTDVEELLDDIKVTAERVQRFKELHEGAVEDLHQLLTQARTEGIPHHVLAATVGEAAALPGRFDRLPPPAPARVRGA